MIWTPSNTLPNFLHPIPHSPLLHVLYVLRINLYKFNLLFYKCTTLNVSQATITHLGLRKKEFDRDFKGRPRTLPSACQWRAVRVSYWKRTRGKSGSIKARKSGITFRKQSLLAPSCSGHAQLFPISNRAVQRMRRRRTDPLKLRRWGTGLRLRNHSPHSPLRELLRIHRPERKLHRHHRARKLHRRRRRSRTRNRAGSGSTVRSG